MTAEKKLVFPEDYPKDWISYVIQKFDGLPIMIVGTENTGDKVYFDIGGEIVYGTRKDKIAVERMLCATGGKVDANIFMINIAELWGIK